MATDLLDMYRRASTWTAGTLAATTDLDAATPCEQWKVRDLLNHLLDTQRYFAATARGEDAAPPGPTPPAMLSQDPGADLAKAQAEVIAAFDQPGVIDKTGPSLGIAFTDQLLHGWDLARATGQDTTMPEGLAEGAYACIHGKFTDEQRQGLFAPEVPVGDDATPQQRLLGYTGRDPS